MMRVFYAALVLFSFLFAQQGRPQEVNPDKKNYPPVSWDKSKGRRVEKVSLVSPRKSKKRKKVHAINAVTYDFIDRAMDSIQAELKSFSLYLGKVLPPPATKSKNESQKQELVELPMLPPDATLDKLKKTKEDSLVFFNEDLAKKKEALKKIDMDMEALELSKKSILQERELLLKQSFEPEPVAPLPPPPEENVDPKKKSAKKKVVAPKPLPSPTRVMEKKFAALKVQLEKVEKQLKTLKTKNSTMQKLLQTLVQNHDQSQKKLEKKIDAREKYLLNYYQQKPHPKKIKSPQEKSSAFGSIEEASSSQGTHYKASIMMIALNGPFVPSLSGYMASEIARRRYRFKSGQYLYFVRCAACEKINLEFRKDGKVQSFETEVSSEDYREQAQELGLDFYGFVILTRSGSKLSLELTLKDVITGDIIFTTDYSKLVAPAGKSSFWWAISGDMNAGNSLSRRIPVSFGTEMGYRISRFGRLGFGVSTGMGYITDVNATRPLPAGAPAAAGPAPDLEQGPVPESSYTFNYLGAMPVIMIDFMDMFRARDRAFSVLLSIGVGPKFLLESVVREKFGLFAAGVEFGLRFCIGQFLFLKLGGQINLAKDLVTGKFQIGPPLDGGSGSLGFGINIF